MRFLIVGVFLLLSAGQLGCRSQHSSAGFRLPADGNADKGKMVFVAHKCNNCHTVSGAGDIPAPSPSAPYRIDLGRECERKLTDGYLVSSIINPSYQLASYPKDRIAFQGHSRMPEYADDLTIRELTDVVAFLQRETH